MHNAVRGAGDPSRRPRLPGEVSGCVRLGIIGGACASWRITGLPEPEDVCGTQ